VSAEAGCSKSCCRYLSCSGQWVRWAAGWGPAMGWCCSRSPWDRLVWPGAAAPRPEAFWDVEPRRGWRGQAALVPAPLLPLLLNRQARRSRQASFRGSSPARVWKGGGLRRRSQQDHIPSPVGADTAASLFVAAAVRLYERWRLASFQMGQWGLRWPLCRSGTTSSRLPNIDEDWCDILPGEVSLHARC
jgi:hypothetical protein